MIYYKYFMSLCILKQGYIVYIETISEFIEACFWLKIKYLFTNLTKKKRSKRCVGVIYLYFIITTCVSDRKPLNILILLYALSSIQQWSTNLIVTLSTNDI